MSLGSPRESWLRGGSTELDHDRFAAAIMKCQHGGGYCAHDGVCHYDGDCFRSAKQAAQQAVARIRAITADSPAVQGWINDAADWVAKTAALRAIGERGE